MNFKQLKDSLRVQDTVKEFEVSQLTPAHAKTYLGKTKTIWCPEVELPYATEGVIVLSDGTKYNVLSNGYHQPKGSDLYLVSKVKDKVEDSSPLEQAAMKLFVYGKVFYKGHLLEKKDDKIYLDGKENYTVPETLKEAIEVTLNVFKSLDDKITDSQITDAFENIKKHFSGAKQFSVEQLKKSGYNKMDDGKYVGLQLYSPWAKENMDKVVNTLYDMFSKQHNYNTSPKNTKKWIQEMLQNNIESNPEGAFQFSFGVIDGWVDKLKELVTSQVLVEHMDPEQDSADKGNKGLE